MMTINNCDLQSTLHKQEIHLPQWLVLCLIAHVMHGHNWVEDMEDVSPTSSGGGDITCYVSPHIFLFWFCIQKGFKNKNDICYIFFEELFMLNGRPHIAKLMLKQSLVWCC